MREPISVVIITKNEEKNIERCLKSVEWADEIVVVDSGSTDNTIKICEKFNCKIIKTPWLGFGKTKQLAVDSASYNWILSLDADEVVTTKLKNEILLILEKNLNKFVYKIKFNTFYLGKMIKYCGWQNEFHTRLFYKKFANYNDNPVHEFIVTALPKKKLNHPIYHYSYPNLETHLNKMIGYSKLGAENLFEKGKKSSILSAVFRGFLKFIKMYFIQLGFLDGKNGLILSFISAFGVSYKYLNLWELKRK